MPEEYASGKDTIFHYKGNITPPKDWNLWLDLVQQFAKAMITRYGLEEVRQWYFETWNEPVSISVASILFVFKGFCPFKKII